MKKTLVIEDNIFKYIDIKKAITKSMSSIFIHANTLEQAKEYLLKSVEENEPFHLIVTDMNFPERSGGKSNPNAGFELIELVKSLNYDSSVIICSTRKFRTDNENHVIGSIRYYPDADLELEFRTLVEKL